jgi:hypothetical protein
VGRETLGSSCTQTHGYCDDRHRDLIHHPRLSSPRGIDDASLPCIDPSLLVEQIRDGSKKYICGVALELISPRVHGSYNWR